MSCCPALELCEYLVSGNALTVLVGQYPAKHPTVVNPKDLWAAQKDRPIEQKLRMCSINDKNGLK